MNFKEAAPTPLKRIEKKTCLASRLKRGIFLVLSGSVLLADCASDHRLRACVPGTSAERRTWTRRFQLGQSGIRKLTTLPPPAAAAWLPVGLRTVSVPQLGQGGSSSPDRRLTWQASASFSLPESVHWLTFNGVGATTASRRTLSSTAPPPGKWSGTPPHLPLCGHRRYATSR